VREASRFCAGCGKSFERKKRGVGFWLAIAFGCVMLAGVISGILDKSTASSASRRPLVQQQTRIYDTAAFCGTGMLNAILLTR
jgi:F0F1-type ATP synthase membrane subunit c/vacuolar-type H+-ATPase subunit K